MNTNFYAERAARNIPHISTFEEEALRDSPEFRKKVIEAFERVNGPSSELKIEIIRGLMILSWFRTTDKIHSLTYKTYRTVKPLIINVYKIMIEEAEKKGTNSGKLNTDEYIKFISSIMIKADSPVEFVKQTHDEKYILFGCRLGPAGEKKPIILINNRNYENNQLELGILVSIYSVENTIGNIANAIVVSNYCYIPDSNSFERKYIRMGFKTSSDLSDIIRWHKH